MIHNLKTIPPYFRQIKDGSKTFEVRKDDRNFKVGEELLLQEFIPANYHKEGDKEEYTGRVLHRKIIYKLPGGQYGIKDGYCVLGIEKI